MTHKKHYSRLTTENRLKLIKGLLNSIYSDDDSANAYEKTIALINKYKQKVESTPYYLTKKDIILITYGDQVFHSGETALSTLFSFLNEYVRDIINTVHILPFYPHSSEERKKEE